MSSRKNKKQKKMNTTVKNTKPLALQYRPQRFADLVGNEIIRTILTNSIRNDKVRTAYGFFGGRGSGKTTSARIFAKALNCTNPENGEPCNKCESCRLISEDKSLDVIEIDAASENSVQSIRELINSLHYLPTNSKRKVVILDEVHCLTVQASNALLKTLEEPPAHVVFIFCTTDPQKVLETIKSRMMMFQFQRLHTSEIKGRLSYICESEGIPYEPEALELISFSVNGGMRDAITLLDQASIYSDKVDFATVKSIIGYVSYSDIIEFISNIEDPEVSLTQLTTLMRKNSPFEIVNSILRFLQDMLFIQNSVILPEMSKDLIAESKVLSTRFSITTLHKLIANCFKTLSILKSSNVFDSSIFMTDLYLSMYSSITGKERTNQLDASLLDLFRGTETTNKDLKDMVSTYFKFTHMKGTLVEE